MSRYRCTVRAHPSIPAAVDSIYDVGRKGGGPAGEGKFSGGWKGGCSLMEVRILIDEVPCWAGL